MTSPGRARDDRFLWWALVLAVALRALPLLVWGDGSCTRDECTYVQIADRLQAGRGMTGSAGWIWAPGYPAYLALHGWLFGSYLAARASQILVAAVVTVLVYGLGRRLFDRATARLAALLYAASPSLAFYAISLWSETLYTATLLGALLALAAARERRTIAPALGLAVLLAACVLLRGIATYLLPGFALALAWRRFGDRSARAQVLALVVGTVALVAPYSAYMSAKYGGLVVSDRTLGQVMWLGNNDFPPLVFDHGYGRETRAAIRAHVAEGRPHCAPQNEPVRRDQCETRAGLEWIAEHPGAFVARIPVRLAQTLAPHSFLTRHLRWGKWPGMPGWLGETLILLGAAASLTAIVVGALGMGTYGRGLLDAVAIGTVAYHLAAVAVTAGMSRYRVPVEPIAIVYAAAVLVRPRATITALGERPLRAGIVVAVLCALLPIVLWYLPSAWS